MRRLWLWTCRILPDAKLCCSDGLPLHREWLPAGRHVVGKGGAVNWNEGLRFGVPGVVEPAGVSDEGVQGKSGSAGVIAGADPGALDGKT